MKQPASPASQGSFVSLGRLTEGQVNKLRRDIEITERHVEVFTELLAEVVPGQAHPEDVALLTEVSRTSEEMQGRIMELVSVVQDRHITAQLLEINDKINNEMIRYERYLSKCKKLGHGKDPEVGSELCLCVISSTAGLLSWRGAAPATRHLQARQPGLHTDGQDWAGGGLPGTV